MTDAATQRTSVCVVGAGPAGLVLALMLRQAEIPCLVLERLSEAAFRRRAGAGMIEHRTVRLLDSHGLAEPIWTHGAPNSTCEFHADGRSFVLDYGELTGGRGHFIYPQHELVSAFAQRFLAAGGEIRFGARVTGVEQARDAATVSAAVEPNGEQLRVGCDFVAACDGARSVLLSAIVNAKVVELQHPFRWLTLIAAAAPSKPRTIYGFHRRGFAGQMRRGPELTRYMLEVPPGDTVSQWPDARTWQELEERLYANGEPSLTRGELVERDILDLRVRVVEPMHHGRVYLTGDAAHLITPAGGKGMNLAIQDAIELAGGLREKYGHDPTGSRLASYSATRLPAIWRTQEFSNWMLTLLHAGVSQSRADAGAGSAEPDEPADFAYRLRRARLQELLANPALRLWFAHAYAGVDS